MTKTNMHDKAKPPWHQ